MPTLPEKVHLSLEKDVEIGTTLTKEKIIEITKKHYPELKTDSSFTPQDACYNKINIGRSTEPIFKFIKQGHYKFLGSNYKYTGDITHTSKTTNTKVKVGYWKDGVKTMIKDIHNSDKIFNAIIYPDEIQEEILIEGAKKQVTINAYERNQKAREACILKYGYKCIVCEFNFEKIYGDIGKDFIHVHHLKALSEVNDEYEVDPIEDLRPVCPNCHAMLHKRKPAYTIDELKDQMKNI